MFFGEIFVILDIALLFSLLLVGGFNWRRGENPAAWPSVIFMFLILFPILWVADLWLQPAGPVVLDVYWVPLLVVGLIVALILAALVPPQPRRRVAETGEPPEAEFATYTAFGMFFWILMLLLVLTIFLGYAIRY